jgi:hypothetical protein
MLPVLVCLQGDTMNRRLATALPLVCSLTVAASVLHPQSTTPPQQSQSTTPPSTQQENPAQATSTTSSSTSPQTTDKKVWTNDDVGDLRDHAPISTIGNPKSAKPANKAAQSTKGKGAKWYTDQIQALEAKLPPLNDKIQQLQAALNGDQVNSTRQYGWVKPDDWRDQLKRLQQERDDIQAKISALIDQARHDGVPTNLLPQQ